MSLANWNKNNILKFSIDYTHVDNSLIDFPVLLNLSSGSGKNNYDCSDVFTTLSGVSNKKIAIVYPSIQEHWVTTSGTTELITYTHGDQEQLYCEIERWDQANKNAQLWVKVPKVLSNQPTDLYLYYDKTQDDNTSYVGDTSSWPAQQAWDDNFAAVYHMSQDPSGGTGCIKDSTSNSNHGTPHGSMTSSDLVDANVGKGIEFDGIDDYIEITKQDYHNTDYTVETIIKPITDSSSVSRLIRFDDRWILSWRQDTHYIEMRLWNGSTETTIQDSTNPSSYVGQYLYISADARSSTTNYLYLNGELKDSGTPGDLVTKNGNLSIGGALGTEFNNSIFKEIRFTTTQSSASWVKCTYLSNFDNLFNITKADIYQFSGYVKELGSPVQRQVYLYDRASGELMDKIVSNSNGYYSVRTTISGAHNIVCLDAKETPDYNDLIISKVTPTETI